MSVTATRETKREVFEALLHTYSQQHTFDDYPINESDGWEGERAEWISRFNVASEFDAQMAAFVELFSSMIADWVKRYVVDAVAWVSVEQQLPPEGEKVDFWVERAPTVDGRDTSSNERGTYNTFGNGRWNVEGTFNGEIGLYCLPGSEKVTHWRPIAPPPLNRKPLK